MALLRPNRIPDGETESPSRNTSDEALSPAAGRWHTNAVERAYLSLSHFPGIEQINFAAEQSLYQTLRERYRVHAAWAAETIEILPATREESKLLDIPTKTGVLSISRNTITEDRMPIEVTVSRYRADRYRALVYIPATAIRVGATIYKEE